MSDKARKWAVAALEAIAANMPFPLLRVGSDNDSEFINHHPGLAHRLRVEQRSRLSCAPS